MGWFKRNLGTIVTLSFIIPIIIVAVVSISHVTEWYGLTNPLTWAFYLSIGVEISALASLSAITVKMGKNVYFPFVIVTLIQFIGNIFFAYTSIDVDSKEFKSWVELTLPIMDLLGVEEGDYIAYKRILAIFSGGMLPLISLSFLHMLVNFNDDKKETKPTPTAPPTIINTVREVFEEGKEVDTTEGEKEFVVEKTNDEVEEDYHTETVENEEEVEEVKEQESNYTNNLPKQKTYSKYTYGRR